MSECYSCAVSALDNGALPSRERVFDDGLWRVAHAFNSALPGWMVVIARRHIASLSDLTEAEAAALGPLLRALSRALEEMFGAEKAYVMFFAEAEGFAHLHIHVVPRQPDQPSDRRGAGIFGYLARPEMEWLSNDEMDRIADELRPRVQAELKSAL